MTDSTPRVPEDAEQSGSRTLKVTWHPNAVSGAVERAAELTSTSDPDGVCQVHWMDLACLLDLARAALAEPGAVELAVMEEALRWRKIVDQWERGHQNDVLPYTAKLEAEVERLQRELDGVATGSTANTGAPVSPVQTTVHAQQSVSGGDARPVEFIAGYLVVPVDGCTCDGGGEFPHRAECGYEPAVPLAEIEAALARAGRTVVAELPERGDMALRMAQARQWIAHKSWGGVMCPPWDGLTPDEREQAETEARYWINAAVNAGVKIVPAGCTVVELPEPDVVDENIALSGNPPILANVWRAGTWEIYTWVKDGEPRVDVVTGRDDGMDVAAMRQVFLAGLAACNAADRLSGSVSPKGDTNG